LPVQTVRFLREFVGSPRRIGAVAPSSPGLARRMVSWIDWKRVGSVVECGPGSGAVTGHILARMRRDCRFFAVELHPGLAEMFRRRYPQVPLVQDSVAHLDRQCAEQGLDRVDCVISSLPWASFSPASQQQHLDAITAVLRPGGSFVTFAYLQGLLLPAGKRFQRLLEEHFDPVVRSRVTWMNLPPAFVYRCRR
jgi:phospholipid N-methyltransferase